jgi:hypothetical protein
VRVTGVDWTVDTGLNTHIYTADSSTRMCFTM